jgi:hypothetical protein
MVNPFFKGENMLTLQHTIVSDSKITAESQRSPKRSQSTPQPRVEDVKKNKPDSTTAEVILFHGCCIV